MGFIKFTFSSKICRIYSPKCFEKFTQSLAHSIFTPVVHSTVTPVPHSIFTPVAHSILTPVAHSIFTPVAPFIFTPVPSLYFHTRCLLPFHVLLHVCTFKVTVQYSIWDRFKIVSTLTNENLTNMAHLLVHLLVTKSLSLSVLKASIFNTIIIRAMFLLVRY